MIQVLGWLGRHAPLVLVVGCLIAFVFPGLASGLRPVLPVFVALVIGTSMARLRPGELLSGLSDTRRLLGLVLLVAVLMPVTAAVYRLLFGVMGFSNPYLEYAVILAAAPPIASAAAFCQFVGLDGRRALEVTLVATVLTPIVGPVTVSLLTPDMPAMDTVDLGLRLAAIILGGGLFATGIRALVGPDGLTEPRKSLALDGLAAVVLILFLVPLFDGVVLRLLDNPGLGLAVLGFSVLLNVGANAAVASLTRRSIGRQGAWTLGLLWGNRNAAVYLAALPPDPGLTLFVALYQFPMYFTPFMIKPFLGIPR